MLLRPSLVYNIKEGEWRVQCYNLNNFTRGLRSFPLLELYGKQSSNPVLVQILYCLIDKQCLDVLFIGKVHSAHFCPGVAKLSMHGIRNHSTWLFKNFRCISLMSIKTAIKGVIHQSLREFGYCQKNHWINRQNSELLMPSLIPLLKTLATIQGLDMKVNTFHWILYHFISSLRKSKAVMWNTSKDSVIVSNKDRENLSQLLNEFTRW